MARTAGDLKNSVVIEVGPGPGPLTRSLLEANAAHVIVVEKDKRFRPSLEMLADAVPGRMTVVIGDALTWDAVGIVGPILQNMPEDKRSLCVVGNLPFNISTPLLIQWMRQAQSKKGIFSLAPINLTLLFQKEVADRIVAKPGTKVRSRIGVCVQRLYKPTAGFLVHSTSFVPAPKVDGKVVHFTPLVNKKHLVDFDTAEKMYTILFHKRRKMVRTALRWLFTKDGDHHALVNYMLNMAGVDGDLRAECLSVQNIEDLALAYLKLNQSPTVDSPKIPDTVECPSVVS